MVSLLEPVPTAIAAFAAGALVYFAQRIHRARIRESAPLAFGPTARGSGWLDAVPAVSGAAACFFIWGVLTLYALDGGRRPDPSIRDRHLMLLLDVSPSMLITDSGPGRDQSRALRAADVLLSILNRAPGNHLKMSAAAFYTHAKPLVQQSVDRNLILYMAQQLPLHIAFREGKTNLVKSVNEAAALCSELPRDSTTLLVISDGDTLSDTGLLPMPPSVSRVLVAGVGDTSRGVFIDSHISRQDSASLSQLARRLKGFYFDCNLQHMPSECLTTLFEPAAGRSVIPRNLRLLALVSACLGALLATLTPWAVHRFGTPRHPALRAGAHPSTPPGSTNSHNPLEPLPL